MRPKRKATANTEMAAKRARGETELEGGLSWREAGPALTKGPRPLLVLDSDTLPGKDKVAGFDIDWTLIRTASGRKFATGSNDWEWWDEGVPDKLRELNENGFKIVFFTNQAGIEKGKVTPDSIRRKIEDMIKDLNIPVFAFVCTGTSHMRKPCTSPWEFMEKNSNSGVKVDRASSIFVGDAAGRAKGWAKDKPKDFSCGDRMFAANLGVKFYTPEEFFLEEDPAPFEWKSVDPQEIIDSPAGPRVDDDHYRSEETELVIMVAPPASGKSTFSRRYFVPYGYTWVNRDTLSTPAKCLKAAAQALADGESVVIDNTNPSRSAREQYIQLAKKHKVPTRCFVLDTPVALAHHLNIYRMNQTEGRQRRVPDVGYAVYNKNYEPPTVKEGFTEVIHVPFVPIFDTKKDEALFKHWTT